MAAAGIAEGVVERCQQDLSAGGRMGGAALPNPGVQGDACGADGLGDVDDPVAVEDGEVRGLTGVGGQRVARGLALLDQVESAAGRPGQPRDREAQPVLAAVGELLDETAASSTEMIRDTVDLCTPSLAAISVTPACPRVARISMTSSARSTDCTDADRPPSSGSSFIWHRTTL